MTRPTMTQVRTAGARGTVDPVRAREPDRSGFAVRAGVRLYYEVHGNGPVTVLLLPPWAIVHSRCWKLQVHYLARHARVVVYDPRGNGRSDRPSGPAAYDDAELVADSVAVLDAVGVEDAVVVGLSLGARVLLGLAADHPERVRGAVFMAPSVVVLDEVDPVVAAFEEPLGDDDPDRWDGWWRWNAGYWRRDLPGFARFFFAEVFPEAHSTRQVEEAVEWALQTDAETLVATQSPARRLIGPGPALAAVARVRCPTLVLQGDDDRITPLPDVRRFAEALGAPLEVVAGGGHCIQARHPVWVNVRLRRFLEEVSGGARA
jgi:pimeloyl-ACP methyl ester carboxylesterase